VVAVLQVTALLVVQVVLVVAVDGDQMLVEMEIE